MQNLGEALRILRTELESAVAEPAGPGASGRLEVEHVSVTLNLALVSAPGEHELESVPTQRWVVTPAPGNDLGHSVTLTFRVREPHAARAVAATASARSAGPHPSLSFEPDSIARLAVAVFGPPGFDNAARAEVFCDWIEGKSKEQVLEVLDALAQARRLEPADPRLSAVQRLRQILKFAPDGLDSAVGVLLELFRGVEVQDIASVVRERWRFGTHWPEPPDKSAGA